MRLRRLLAAASCLLACTLAACGGGTMQVPPPTAPRASSASPPPQTFPARQAWLDEQESPTHTYTLAQAVAQAKRFDLISALPDSYDAYVLQMKAANPHLRLFVYLNGTMANGAEAAEHPESWFLHGADGGRLLNSYHLTLADPANPAWVASRVDKCRTLLAHSGYDGCFLDNLGSGTWRTEGLSTTPVDPATQRPYSTATWLARTAHLAQVVQSETGRPVFGNGLINGTSYLAPAASSSVLLTGTSMGCAETFVRDPRQGIATYRSVAQWQQDVDMLVQAAAQGHSIATITKVWDAGTPQQIDDWHLFALGTFLLGADTRQYFEFSGSPRAPLTDGDPMLARLGVLGAPRGRYTGNGGLYERAFIGGVVLVDPGDSPVTAPLGSTYTDAFTGSKVGGQLTLAPHQARVLVG